MKRSWVIIISAVSLLVLLSLPQRSYALTSACVGYDVNWDGSVNVADLQALYDRMAGYQDSMNDILYRYDLTLSCVTQSVCGSPSGVSLDANKDGSVTVADLQVLINQYYSYSAALASDKKLAGALWNVIMSGTCM